MLSSEMKSVVSKRVKEVVDIANNALSEIKNTQKMDIPTISYNLKGRTAGLAFINANKIKLNEVLLTENFDHFLDDTIPHEIAHLVVQHFYGRQKQAHGRVWKNVMFNIFNLNPKRCHSLDTSNSIGRNCRKFEYKCECDTHHMISAVRHNRIAKGRQSFRCNRCKSTIKFTGNITDTKTLYAQSKGK